MAATFQTALKESEKLYRTLKSLIDMPLEYKTVGFQMDMATISNKVQSCNELLTRMAQEIKKEMEG
jgi:hypothetical protein